AKGEQQQAHAGAAVRGLLGRQEALDAGLRVAADDRGGVTRGHLTGGLRPGGRLGGDDEPGRGHRERLGKGVLDGYVVDGKQRTRPATSTRPGANRTATGPSCATF